ncbi:AAA family ATPase [Nakamurella antarctica]|uniref:AAA family ATPase n=1 Tax=Nakamurella antarctica TaxID=1902245 RepID=A0A3G8ZS99_9ACTN|nr:AAA family ATPase [Nakamurella antarctica]AZI56956.1 AAA family ATPase [Nakamurella antarctica]
MNAPTVFWPDTIEAEPADLDMPEIVTLGAKATPKPVRELTLTAASKIRMRKPTWLWDTAPKGAAPQDSEGRIPVGSLTIAAGQAGIGKSQFTLWLVARLTTGTLPGTHYGKPKSVIIAANEDSREMTIGPRLLAAGADMSRVYFVDVVTDNNEHAQLTLPTDTKALGRLIEKNNVGLLVCDPLLSALGAEINDYRGKEVRAALDPLVEMADRTKCAVVGLAHFNKSAPSGDPLLAIQGAAAFGQLIRAGIGFAREEAAEDADETSEPTFVMSTTKNNLGRDNLPSLQYKIIPTPVETDDGTAWVSRYEFTGSTSERSVRDIMRANAEGRPGEDSSGQRSIDSWLTSLLTEANYRATEVYSAADAAGYSKDQTKRAKARLGIEAYKPEFNGPWHWRLTNTEPPREQEGSEASTHTHTAPFAPLAAPLGTRTCSECQAAIRTSGGRCVICIIGQGAA